MEEKKLMHRISLEANKGGGGGGELNRWRGEWLKKCVQRLVQRERTRDREKGGPCKGLGGRNLVPRR